MSKPAAKTVKPKGSLNAKAKVKQTFKFVIKNPYSDFWPTITQDETNQFNVVVKALKAQENWKNFVQFGMASILRSIKNSNQTLNCVAISLNFKPYFITKQIINLILTKPYKINVILVENLEFIVKETFGFASWCIGFKNINENSSISHLLQKITTNYEPPIYVKQENPINIEKNLEKLEKMDVQDEYNCDDFYLKKSSTSDSRVYIPEREFIDLTDKKVRKTRKIKVEHNSLIKFNKANLYQDTFIVKVRKKE